MINLLTPLLTQFAWQMASPPEPEILDNAMRQLAVQSPVLLLYVVGLVLALVFWKRSPTASICTVIGLILMLATGVVMVFLQNYFLQARLSQHWSTFDVNRAMGISNIVANLVRAIGLILILVAIFVKRASAEPPRAADYRTMRMQ
jgi:hypothetical protein